LILRRIASIGLVLALLCVLAPVALAGSAGATSPHAASQKGGPADTRSTPRSSNFDWTDAGIGAAGGFGLATIAAATVALIRTRGPLTTN
jgi:hypothetical protein